jgi:putative mycofactocin binding protein MftB
VALRREAFGALAYSSGSRKLSFSKSTALVTVVESLVDYPSAAATLSACGVPEAQRPAFERALAELARSSLIEPRESA